MKLNKDTRNTQISNLNLEFYKKTAATESVPSGDRVTKSFALFDRLAFVVICCCVSSSFLAAVPKVNPKMGEPSVTPPTVVNEDQVTLTIKWSNSEYLVDELTAGDTVADLKSLLYSKTAVKPARQKLMGLKTKNGSILLFYCYYFYTNLFYFCARQAGQR